MKCKNCGLDHEGNFCPRCGAPSNFTPPPPQQPQQQQQPPIQPQPGYQMPPNQQMYQQPPKKKKNTGCLIAIIVVLILFFLFALIPTDENDTSSDGATTADETQKEDPETYKSQCQNIPYDDLARTPDNYEGQKVTFTGEIIQVQESGDEATYRINVTQNEYGNWDDTVLCYFDLSNSESRFLEDDIVTFYGDYDGLYTYTSIVGSDVTIPSVTIHYIELSQ